MFDREYTRLEKMQRLYWKIVPHDWRPSEVWYRLKCFLFKRYTTVKPKTLPYHTWVDRDVLLLHTMFQILTDFVEQECSPGVINWYHEHAGKIRVGGKEKFVRDELQDLYNWWQQVPEGASYDYTCPKLNKFREKVYSKLPPIRFEKIPDSEYFEMVSDKTRYDKYCVKLIHLENKQRKVTKEYMKRLVRVSEYLWT